MHAAGNKGIDDFDDPEVALEKKLLGALRTADERHGNKKAEMKDQIEKKYPRDEPILMPRGHRSSSHQDGNDPKKNPCMQAFFRANFFKSLLKLNIFQNSVLSCASLSALSKAFSMPLAPINLPQKIHSGLMQPAVRQ